MSETLILLQKRYYMTWKYSWNKLANYRIERPEEMIFCDINHYYIGTLNHHGKWLDYESNEFIDEIEGWAFLPPDPVTFGQASVVQEWIKGNGPVPYQFTHFLLFDTAKSEMVYRDIHSNYFDSSDRTFPEVTHFIVLPNLPMHARDYNEVRSVKADFLTAVREKLGDQPLYLEPFNEECLSQAIGEILNTSINGVPQINLLHDEELFSEILAHWESLLDTWLKTSANNLRAEFTYGTTKVPRAEATRTKLKQTFAFVANAFGK